MESKLTESTLNFYTLLDYNGSHNNIDGNLISRLSIPISYPCVLLIRNNSWNDYSHVSHFYAYYFLEENNYSYLGIIKIIKANNTNEPLDSINYKTELDESFTSLDDNTFFSKGDNEFYESLKQLENGIGNRILGCLNEIVYKRYPARKFINSGDEFLVYGYKNSLLRGTFESISRIGYKRSAENMVSNILDLANQIPNEDLNPTQQIQLNLLYGSAVATLESFLKDAFMYHLLESSNNTFILKFLNSKQSDLKRMEFELSIVEDIEILKIKDSISNVKEKVKTLLSSKAFTDLKFIENIYIKTLGINLPAELWDFSLPLENRHLIFHRNGLDENDNLISLTKDELIKLLGDMNLFIMDVHTQLETQLG